MDSKRVTNQPPSLLEMNALQQQKAKKSAKGAASPLITSATDLAKAEGRETGDVGQPSYGVNLSGQAREMAAARAKAFEIARNAPDVREDKVAALKKKIDAGEYRVNPEAVADGFLAEALRDAIALEMQEEAKSKG